MWIVRLALSRPFTFIVIAILLFIMGPLAIMRTPTDIFPNINIPVVSIVWSFNGFSAQDMAQRITSNYERALTSDVENIEHIESQSLNGVSVIQIFFHPRAAFNAGKRLVTQGRGQCRQCAEPDLAGRHAQDRLA